jgi:hypothetical protein
LEVSGNGRGWNADDPGDDFRRALGKATHGTEAHGEANHLGKLVGVTARPFINELPLTIIPIIELKNGDIMGQNDRVGVAGLLR